MPKKKTGINLLLTRDTLSLHDNTSLKSPNERLHVSLFAFNQSILPHSRLRALNNGRHKVFAKHCSQPCLRHFGRRRIQPREIFAALESAHLIQFLSRKTSTDDDCFWGDRFAGGCVAPKTGRGLDVLSLEKEG